MLLLIHYGAVNIKVFFLYILSFDFCPPFFLSYEVILDSILVYRIIQKAVYGHEPKEPPSSLDALV